MTNIDYLPCVEIETEPDAPATASLIGLHGLGADGHDLAHLASSLPIQQPVRWRFPHAPVRPVSLHGGVPMPAWYDIYGLDFGSQEDKAGLKAAAQSIERLIQREIDRGIPSERIFPCGFSQGGALALSTYLPVAKQLAQEASSANRRIPIFMAHGNQDTVVPLEMGEGSKDRLEALGYAVDFHRYAMAHSICTQEIADMGAWIQRLI